ncbi:MAG: cation:dicarboxylase symporter family transporter [Thiomargarita sp.]|nr:cation:dicarboxylase symporter family transporter [Thiomargarita sp.]
MWSKFINNFITIIEQHLWWLSIIFFMIGIFWADQSTDFAYLIGDTMDGFIDGYSYFAPIAIYLILTPTLLKLFLSETHGKSFAKYTIKWFVVARIIACVYAVIFTVIAFDLPLYSSTEGFMTAVNESFQSLAWMLTHSVYFYAVYVSLITVVIALKIKKLANILVKGVDLIEYLGKFIIPIIPFLMLAIGAYVTILPEVLEKTMGPNFSNVKVDTVTMLGFTIDISSSLGMILLYVLGALLTGLVCGIWHIGLLILAKRHQPDFSLKKYFSVYWIKVYPMLWATSSEALATPLNLYMVKKLCPTIPDEVRQFVVGTGSFLNINGTIINVFLMTGLVAAILDIDISMLQLLLSIPIVFLIGYGVPGIPGELVLFGGPIAICMGVSPELMPAFLGLYIGLQIGLPDSFRTASNSTDECLCAIILNKKVVYDKLV